MAASYGSRAMSLIARVLRLVSLLTSLVIIVSFSFFATDLASEASEGQRTKVAEGLEPTPTAPNESDRERRSGAFREAVDDVNDVLLAPFAVLVEGQNIWVQRIATGVLGLLLYGLALSLLANYIRK